MGNHLQKVVVMGGGTGVFTVLNSLKEFPVHLQAIVTMADDGGSSGVLREEFGILPPGDVRRALIALAPESMQNLSNLFNYRFSQGGGLKGHTFGNLFLTALERLNGGFDKAIKEASRILNIKGDVIPVTLENIKLLAKLNNGVMVDGETNIDKSKYGNCKIQKIFLDHKPKANKEALEAIRKADYIIVGPGDLYTSIIPNFLVSGISSAFKKSKAKKFYICNITTKYEETDGFTAFDFLKTVEKYIGDKSFDYFIINKSMDVPKKFIQKYRKEKKELVKYSSEDFRAYKKLKIIESDLSRHTGLLRHDPKKLGKLLYGLILMD
jgi:uncharacterized cofD-like protein